MKTTKTKTCLKSYQFVLFIYFVVVNIYNQTKCLRIIKIYEIHTKSIGIKLNVLEFITSIKIVQNIYNPAKCYNCFEILSNA